MHILRLTAENVKRLKAVTITPKGNIVRVTGKNASGKSSVLDSIMYALGGASTVPSQPIRDGQEQARIKLDLGDLLVTRTFGPNGSELRVETDKGVKVAGPQKVLDALLGALTFDPLEFTRLKPRQQWERLREIANVTEDLDAIDAEVKALKEERTATNRDIKSLKSHIEGFVDLPEDLPEVKLSAADLNTELQVIYKATTEASELSDKHQRKDRKLKELDEEVARFEAKLAEVKAERDKVLAYELPEVPELVDPAPILAKMRDIEAVNAQVDQRDQKRRMETNLADFERDYATVGNKVDGLLAKKQAAIAAADMPVPGLSFGDDCILLEGVPLEQASTAERIRVSVAIAMAANPKLKIIRIMEGSLLDEDSLQLIADMAGAYDYQVWIEEVTNGDRVGIVIEDGMVAGDFQEEATVVTEAF